MHGLLMSLSCKQGLGERTQARVAYLKLSLLLLGRDHWKTLIRGSLGWRKTQVGCWCLEDVLGDWQSLRMCERDRHVKLLPCTRPRWCLTVDRHSQNHFVLLTALRRREVKAEGQVACLG